MSPAHSAMLPELLAVVAGGLILASTVGKSLARLRAYRHGTGMRSASDLWRDGLQYAGNVLWVCFGILGSHVALTVMCGINVATLTILIVCNWLAPPRGGPPTV